MRKWLLMGGLVVTLTALVVVIAASYSDHPGEPSGPAGEASPFSTEPPSSSPSPTETLIPLPDMAGIPQKGAALLVVLPEGDFCFQGYIGSDEIEGCRDTKVTIERARGLVTANARLTGPTEGRMTIYLVNDGELVDSAQTVTRAKPVSVSGHF